MSANTNEPASRRKQIVQQAEYKAFVELYKNNLTEEEINASLGIKSAKYAQLLNQALKLSAITFREEPYITVLAKALPQSLMALLNVGSDEAVIKAEVDNDALKLSVIKIDRIKFDQNGNQITGPEALLPIADITGGNDNEYRL